MRIHFKIYTVYFSALLLMLLLNSFSTFHKIPDYSGNWVINLQKSKFGEVPLSAAVQQYRIEQKDTQLILTMSSINEKEETVSSVQNVSLDGSVSTIVLPNQRTRKISAVYSKEQNVLMLTKSYSKSGKPEEEDYVLKENLKLGDDGKEMVVVLTSPSYAITISYDKSKEKK